VRLKLSTGALSIDQQIIGAGHTDSGPRLMVGVIEGKTVPKSRDAWQAINPALRECSVLNDTHFVNFPESEPVSVRATPLADLSDGLWHHIAVSYDTQQHDMWLDGQLVSRCWQPVSRMNKSNWIHTITDLCLPLSILASHSPGKLFGHAFLNTHGQSRI
jgi:hypothetical protein